LGILGVVLGAGCGVRNPYFNPDSAPSDAPQILDVVSTDMDGGGDTVAVPDTKPWPCTGDHQCDDKIPCTTDKCSPQKTCTNTINAGYCLVAGKCYKQGDNPGNDICSVCSPSTSATSWTAKADGLACASDKLDCTTDACLKGKCTHQPKSNYCAISGACYLDGANNPKESCQFCDANIEQYKWTVAKDNTACASDSISCTTDRCKSGKCTHTLYSGYCLISKLCVKKLVTAPSDPCSACIPERSTSKYLYSAGLPCTVSSSIPGMCFNKKCMAFQQKLYEPSTKDAYAALTSVAYVPAAKAVWAAGRRGASSKSTLKGVLVDTAAVGSSFGSPEVLSGQIIYRVHHRLAVGGKGEALLYDSGKWTEATSLKKILNGVSRYSVWGASIKGVDTYHITGTQSSADSAIIRCTMDSSKNFKCASHTGVGSGLLVGRILGTLTSSGGQGPLWAVLLGDTAPEHIYYNPGTLTTWGAKPPQGCEDKSGTPCSNSPYETLDLNGSGANDLWMVGSGGMILAYDGKGWGKKTNQFSYQTSYSFFGVFSSLKDKLTTLVGVSNGSGDKGHKVRLFNFNHDLQYWFGPITLSETPQNTPDYIFDIGGQDYNNLWLVGQRQVAGSGTTLQTKGWILQLK